VSRTAHKVIVVAWLAALATALGAVSERTAAFATSERALVTAPPLATLDRRLVDVVTLGYRHLYDDFATVWLLQFLADEKLKTRPPEEVQRAVRVVTRLGPQIESLYLFACVTLSRDLRRPDLCDGITRDGVRALPAAWRLPAMQGYVCAFLLKDDACAATWYTLAGSRPQAPKYIARFGEKLTRKEHLEQGELDQTIQEILGQGLGARLDDLRRELRAAPQAPKAETPTPDASPTPGSSAP
jgi:hypothetical protein